MKQLRVLHLIPSLGPLRGGPSAVVRALANSLVAAGVAVDIAATDDNGPGRLKLTLGRPLQEQGVTYHYFARQTRFYTLSWPLAGWLDRHVAKYDLVHIHALFSFASLAGAACAVRRQVPYVVRPLGTLGAWGMQNRRPLLKRLSFALFERRILAGAAAVQYTSEQERAEAMALGLAQRPVVIANPVQLDRALLAQCGGRLRAQYPQLAGRIVALFLGRLDPIKGLDLLLPAFAQARAQNPRLSLVLAGEGHPVYVEQLRTMAAQLGLHKAVTWAGFLAGEAKLAALADADLFVLPSRSENFGLAVAEAACAGLPVIVSDRVGIHHEIAAAGAGLVVPCAVAPLADALAALAADGAKRAAMGAAGRRLADERFAPRTVVAQLLALYGEIAQPPAGALQRKAFAESGE